MKKEEQLIYLHTCSEITALSLKEFFGDNGIPCFIRNDMYSGNIAGFGAALPGSDTRVFVKKRDFMHAKVLLQKYLNALESE